MDGDRVAAAAAALQRTGEEGGGAYQEPEAYRGSCARTMFDRPGAKDGTVTALLPEARMADLRRGSYVRISSVHPRTGAVDGEYLGVVAAGPFAEPDALAADAPTLVVAAAHGAVLTPKYHGLAELEVFGQRVGAQVIPPLRRPSPNSPVFLLEAAGVASVLGLNMAAEDRPLRLGLMADGDGLVVSVPAAKKSVLFKHLAILGTTGGGKSTSVSGLMTRLAEQGNAVVVFDVEGEYTTIDEPADHPAMVAALQARGLAPKGAERTRLFVLAGREPANPEHADIRRFKLAFSDMSPHLLSEIMALSEAQERRLIDAYECCRVAMERFEIFPCNEREQQEALEIDDLETGWPRMTLRMLLDLVQAGIQHSDKNPDGFRPRSPQFQGKAREIMQIVEQRQVEKNKISWLALAKRLWRMHKANVFGEAPHEFLDPADVLEAGLVSVIDLSDMDAPYLRNLVIAQMLRRLQIRQDEVYREREEAQRDGRPLPEITRANIFIEEAHEFLSAQRIKQMPNLFEQVARIARRGRKRYLGLAFVTQLPGHLPDEVLGLVNNWMLHKLTDTGVIGRLRKAIPMVTDATWNSLPNLAPGQALCSFTFLARPIVTHVDPSPCRLRMVD